MPHFVGSRFALCFAPVVAAAGGSFSAEAEAIFAAFSTPPDSTRKTVIDTCVVALKSAGVWTKLDALYLFAAADSQAAIINWKAPGTFNATATNSPTFTANSGFTGNGSSSYIDTNFNASTAGGNYALNSASYGFWDLTAAQTGSNVCQMGALDSGHTSYWLFNGGSSDTYARINSDFGASAGAQPATQDGFWSVCRTASNVVSFYRNGASAYSDGTTASTALVNRNMVALGRNNGGTPDQFDSAKFAAAFIGGGLTSGENTSFYNAVSAYLTSVGAI